MPLSKYNIIYFASLVTLSVKTEEIFSSTAVLENLLETQKRIIEEFDNYKDINKHLDINRYIDEFRKEDKIAMTDIPSYIGHPINAFTLMKRMTVDLKRLNETAIGKELIGNVFTKYKNITIATSEDLVGAAAALARLQYTYKLNVKDLSEGRLNGAFCSPMTPNDCFELGLVLYKEKDYGSAQAWMIQAFRKYNKEKVIYPFTELHITEYLYLSDDKKNTTNVSPKVLYEQMMAPGEFNFRYLLASIAYIRRAFPYTWCPKKYSLSMMIFAARILYLGALRIGEQPNWNWNVFELCSGKFELPIEESSRLTCRYLSENHAFLKIAPFKIETLYHDPDITLFHNVISDAEIETIKLLARPKIKRSVVFATLNVHKQSPFRISQSVFLPDKNSNVVARLSQRAMHMTGLNMETAEPYSIINYGIGGHYTPHYDFTRKSKNVRSGPATRIATLLFYLSDVSQGGATIFLNLGLSVFPVKGTAIYWNNLHPSGMGNLATLHAACPVLQGSKWVMTKWISLAGQEFIRPCSLEFQDEVSLPGQFPKPVPKTILQ